MTTFSDRVLADLDRVNPVAAAHVAAVSGSAWADELEDAIISSPPPEVRPRRSPRSRGRMVAVVATASLVLAGGAALATVAAWPDHPEPDLANAIRSETLAGYRLTLAPVAGDANRACFVVQDPAGPRLSTCSARSDVLTQGDTLSSANSTTGMTTVWGVAPDGATSVSLGTSRADVTPDAFYVVKGPSDGVLTLYRDGAVVKQTDLGATPSIPTPVR